MKISEDKKTKIVLILLGIYVVLLLWLTLFSRSPFSQVYIFYPFKTYVELFNGDISALFYILGNILLFIPVGYFTKLFIKKNCIITVLIGLGVSLIIELIQLFTKLGCFEFDDLMHNSIGTLIGCLIYKRFPLSISFNIKKFAIWTFSAVIITSVTIFSITKISNQITYQKMIEFAALNDNGDQKNLLIPNGDEGEIHGQGVFLEYLDNGKIRVSGSSEDGEWIKIGEFSLESGDYYFGGISDDSIEDIVLVLQYINEENQVYSNLTPYIALDGSTEFTLDKETSIRAYILVYSIDNFDVQVSPAIYKK